MPAPMSRTRVSAMKDALDLQRRGGGTPRRKAFRRITPLSVVFVLLLACLNGCVSPPAQNPEATGGTRAPAASQPTHTLELAEEPSPLVTSAASFLRKLSRQHVRVMSFNPGWDSIFPDDDPQNDSWRHDSKPSEFVRIVRAIQPDILCLQEIKPARDPQQVADILDAALPLDEGGWQAQSGQDNVIAARFELRLRDSAMVIPGPVTNFGHALALVDLPDAEYARDLYLICAHFASQGGQANVEARQAHADAIVQWLGDLQTPGGEIDLPVDTPVMVLGDLNVYDTDPAYHLTTLLTGDVVDEARYGPDIKPDWDGTALTDALPRHNATGEDTYTWRDDTQEFNPGVLDHILFTDSVLSVEHAFVLNTLVMTEADLEAAGLQAADVLLDLQAGRYDHLPLVVDVAPRAAGGQP
jgi:endonuclease/exonuclease/phosphatase family metal-dependent hydrolase